MKRWMPWLVVVTLAAGLLGAGAAFIFSRTQNGTPTKPTLTLMGTVAPSDTAAPTLTMTDTATTTMTATATATASTTPTSTPTLATLVIQITAVNPDVARDTPMLVTLSAASATPRPTLAVPSPGSTLANVPTGEVSPVVGWLRYGVDNPALQKVGDWQTFTSTYRSANRRYLFSDASGAALTLRFLGGALRVRYARLSSYGVFEVRLDGQLLTTVDTYLPKSAANGDFVTTPVFGLAYGWHMLEIVRLDRRNPNSTGGFVAIDGIDVYQDGPEPTLHSTNLPLTPTATASPAPVQKIQVLVAPPTVQPTPTLAPVQITAVTLTIAYDQNGNKAIDPTEGVRDLPVELISADTNRVVASGVTDGQGNIRLEAAGTVPLRLVVPYFNRFWDIAAHTSGTRITLLIPPANRPALIP